jgi:exodeoxyribonuclease-5
MQKLTNQQAEALSAIGAWLKASKDGGKQYLTLGGYAGTGKTTLLAALRRVLRSNMPTVKVGFVAYTGKAALVLRHKLVEDKILQPGDSISTLHGLMYYSDSGKSESPKWRKRESLKVDLVVVDEASMVSEEIWNDLISFGRPVLAVGDHGQLPPIGNNFNLMLEPDLKLDKIWRQAADSPIIAVSKLARNGSKIPIMSFGDGVVKLDQADPQTGDIIEEILQSHDSDTLVLCGYNSTRQKLNDHVRVLKGIDSPDPQRNDTIVCLRNSRDTGLSNGQIGVIEQITPAVRDDEQLWWNITADFDGIKFSGFAPREQFGAATTIKTLPKRPKTDTLGLFDFGYGLTVHKAQGSQAKRVLIFEERFPRMTQDEWQRWLYTAVTRAQKELYIIGH